MFPCCIFAIAGMKLQVGLSVFWYVHSCLSALAALLARCMSATPCYTSIGGDVTSRAIVFAIFEIFEFLSIPCLVQSGALCACTTSIFHVLEPPEPFADVRPF